MKQKNKEKRLKARQNAHDELIKRDCRYATCTTRPGSMKK
jgi:hypothetical protein